jgi:hypothetical protein
MAEAAVPKPPPEEDPAIAEMKQAALEEKDLQTEGKIPDRGYEVTLNGTYLASKPLGATREDVPGEFQVTGYAYAFQVKVLDPKGVDSGLLSRLQAFNSKKVTLAGKIRNKSTEFPQGQFFILSEIITQPGGTFVPTKGTTVPGRL